MKQINSILRTLCLVALLCMTSVSASAYVVYDDTMSLFHLDDYIGTDKKDKILVIDKDITTDVFAVVSGCAYIIKTGATVTVNTNFLNSKDCILYVFGSLDLSETINKINGGIIYKVDGGTIINESNIIGLGPGLINNVSHEDIISKTKLGQEREPGKPGWKDCWAKGISHGDDFYPIYYYEDEECMNEITDFETWKTNAGQIPAEGTTEWVDGQFPDSKHNYVGWKGYCKFTYEDNGEEAYYENIDYINKIEDLEAWKNGKGSLTLVKVNGQRPTIGNDGWKDYYKLTEGNGTTTYYEDEECMNEITDFETWKTNAGKITAKGTTEWVDGQFPDSKHNYVGWKGYCKFTYEDNGEEAYYEDIDYINKIEDLEAWKNGKGSLTLVKVNGQKPTIGNDGWRDYYELTEGNVTTTYYEDEACEIKIEDIEEWKNGEGKLCIFQLGEDCYIHNGRIIDSDVCFKDKVVYDLNVNLDVTGKITYSRTFNNTNWQPLYVPFAISYDEWKGNFDVAAINNFHEYTDEDGKTVKTELEVRLVKDHTLKPNHPYLIKAHDADNCHPQEINLSTKKMYKSDENSIVCSSVERKYTFTGTYQDVTGMKTKNYIFLSGGKLCKAEDDEVVLSPQRWYLKITSLGSQFGDNNNVGAKAFSFDVKLLDDETTGIDEITVTRTPLKHRSEAIYNLNGMRVNEGYKGIVIKNGKKVYQK